MDPVGVIVSFTFLNFSIVLKPCAKDCKVAVTISKFTITKRNRKVLFASLWKRVVIVVYRTEAKNSNCFLKTPARELLVRDKETQVA